MFQIYNSVLREQGKQVTQDKKNKLLREPGLEATQEKIAERSPVNPGGQQLFTTTIHLISSGLIKLARLQPSVKLYRGLKGRRMPDR